MKSDLPERTFEFAKRVVLMSRLLDGKGDVERTLANRLLRSVASIGANVDEAQASKSYANRVSKYGIVCKEATDPHLWLRLLWATDTVGIFRPSRSPPGIPRTEHHPDQHDQ